MYPQKEGIAMPLCSMKDLLKRADASGYAVGSFSVANMECIQGVLQAAETLRSPVILQIAEIRLPCSPLYLIGPMMLAAARQASVPVAVHLDHGKTMDCIREALDLGFTSVMCDASHLPIEENIRFAEETVRLAEKYGAAVEAEVGQIGRGEDGAEQKEVIASVDDALRMDGTGIDALAVGIGNAHGLYAQAPHLRYDVLDQLYGRIRSALVLHGGSGLSDEQYRHLIRCGMRKMNIATDLFRAQAQACSGEDIFTNIKNSSQAVSGIVARNIRLFGSEGKA